MKTKKHLNFKDLPKSLIVIVLLWTGFFIAMGHLLNVFFMNDLVPLIGYSLATATILGLLAAAIEE